MTDDLEPDGSGRQADAIDRAIDEAIGAELRGGPGDLAARVLARLDEPVEDRPRWRAFVLRPAVLPAAGVLLIVAFVAFSWWRVDDQLYQAGRGPALTDLARAEKTGPPSGPVAAGNPAPQPAGTQPSPATPKSAAVAQPAGGSRRQTPGGGRVFAASLLPMDAMSRPRGVAADAVVTPDEEPEPFLPGAPGWDLGEPIKPIPKPRPIVIPSIVAAPLVDAPPVSTLATPVSTLTTDNSSRDLTGPGKTGGVRP